jgi:hypothetical protein
MYQASLAKKGKPEEQLNKCIWLAGRPPKKIIRFALDLPLI